MAAIAHISLSGCPASHTLAKVKRVAMEKGNHVCLECGDPIVYGRVDRKFCCDKCKNSYNNRKIRKNRLFREKILRALDRNYKILTRLEEIGVETVGLHEMMLYGFNKEFVTSVHREGDYDEYWCYDMKFCSDESHVFAIEREVPLLPPGHRNWEKDADVMENGRDSLNL